MVPLLHAGKATSFRKYKFRKAPLMEALVIPSSTITLHPEFLDL